MCFMLSVFHDNVWLFLKLNYHCYNRDTSRNHSGFSEYGYGLINKNVDLYLFYNTYDTFLE